MAIVYSQAKDEKEYLRYVNFLKSKGYFTNNIEIVELEGLQGVNGMKAIRAEILYSDTPEHERVYTYEKLDEGIGDGVMRRRFIVDRPPLFANRESLLRDMIKFQFLMFG